MLTKADEGGGGVKQMLTISDEGGRPQSPKKSQLSGRQTLTRKNFPDEVRKFFLRHVCQKCVNRFHDI